MTTKPKPSLRGDVWYLCRRVPARYESVEPRQKVLVSLATDCKAIAEQKAPLVWAQLIEGWEAQLAGDTTDAQMRFDAAKDFAQARGLRFMDVRKVAALPLNDLLPRIEATLDSRGTPNKLAAEALLGGAERPLITVSKALDKFYEVEAVRVRGKSDDQLRRHKAPRLKATLNFIKAHGSDPAIETITTRDMFAFRAWWQKRISAGEVGPGSANKDFSYLMAMWRAVARHEDMPLQISTDGLAFEEDANQRPAFSREWIETKLLPGLASLNDEARGIVEIMVNTGARPSEISGLSAARIVLDSAVPHILIAGEGRTLKSRNAQRAIPLVGVSLDAARRNPAGFPRYADDPGLSDTVNKFFTENSLRETPGHSMYSLRHSFESRMQKADFTERMKADLMGHSLKRERYGEADLAHVRDWLLKIAI